MSYLDFNLQQYNRYTVLKPSVIQAIKNGSKLLSVGIGLGYYEEYLINTHGISRSSIHCADLHLDEKWSSHTSYIFDICSPWPNLNQKYDYILFGQVIGVSAINKGGKKSQIMAEHVENVISQAARWLDVGGEIIVFDTTIQTVPTQWHIQQHELWETVANAIGGTITGNEKEWCVVNISI
ncbi:hypothetical protein EQV97_14060 [Pseudomonas sp. TMW22090]|uniref:hypothetical protein n=1 Tax=Pseudomonas sp. TMW22090 TaxID=2506434 RepID=UPI001F0EC81A|nr:hypothetical protein [Pseudomonas sp. TMW22090]MCH4878511.1 hypothetical protein [Pseudomonas sp. TMW22090]